MIIKNYKSFVQINKSLVKYNTKHNQLNKVATVLPFSAIPIIACNEASALVLKDFQEKMKELNEQLAQGAISEHKYNIEVSDLKNKYKVALELTRKKITSSGEAKKIMSIKKNYKEENENIHFEGKTSDSTAEIDSLHSIDEPEPSNLITRAVSWVKKKLHISNKPKTEISQENIAIVPGTTEFDIAKDKEFIAIAYSDDIDIPDTLEGFVDLSSGLIDPSELSDTVLDSIVDDLDLYNGISGAIKIFIEDIFDL